MQSTFPFGLDMAEELEKISEGGSSLWLDFDSVRLYTNAFIRQDEKVCYLSTLIRVVRDERILKTQLLLGYKKRGFGKDL